MGLLTGSYMKIMAMKMRLQMDHKMQTIQMQLVRTQKQIDMQQKMLDGQQRGMETMLNYQQQQSIFMGANRCGIQNPNNPMSYIVGEDLSDSEKATRQAQMQEFAAFQQQIQYMFANAKNTWLNYFESIKEATLQPLKDQEARLQQEMETTKMRRDTYKMMEETAEKQKQESRKDFMPGQG